MEANLHNLVKMKGQLVHFFFQCYQYEQVKNSFQFCVVHMTLTDIDLSQSDEVGTSDEIPLSAVS